DIFTGFYWRSHYGKALIMLSETNFLVTISGVGSYPPLVALFGIWAISWLAGFGFGYVFSLTKTLFSSFL
ncbi:hypothetical protein, partial [Escherichia coli]